MRGQPNKKVKIGIVVSAIWVLSIFSLLINDYDPEWGKDGGEVASDFILYGILPLVIAWGIAWIRK